MKLYKFYNDPGHGWLAVKRKELVELGVIGQISSYSYQRGNTVYLEEDGDASRFINAYVAKGLCESASDFPYESKYCQNRSPIRSYDSFKA